MTNIGGAALPVFLDESNPRVAACPAMLVYADAVAEQKIGSPALPIKFLAAGDLVENGGPYCVAPGPARKIALAPGAPRSGERCIPVYPAPGYEWIVDSLRGTPPTPAYLIYDTFTDTDGTNLTAHTPDTAPVGASWAYAIGAGFTVQSNKASCNGVNDQLIVIQSGDADVDVILASMTLGQSSGIVARATGTGLNCILALFDTVADEYGLYACQGAYTKIASAAAVLTPGDIVTNGELKVTGTSIEFLVNGVSKVSATSAVHQTETKIGLFGYGENGTAKYDSLTVAAL